MWRSRGCVLTLVSGMERVSVKSSSEDRPGPAGSSAASHTLRPVPSHSWLSRKTHWLFLEQISEPQSKQETLIVLACIYTQDQGVCGGRRLVQVSNVSATKDAWQHLICSSRRSRQRCTRPAMLAIPVEGQGLDNSSLLPLSECLRCSRFSGKLYITFPQLALQRITYSVVNIGGSPPERKTV